MEVRNCVKCGRIFNYAMGKPICPNCRKDLEVTFKEVRLYIRKNPKSSIAEISEACQVEVKQIKEWIREERLIFSKDSMVGIDCENCGKTIKTGRFCAECKSTMTKEMESVMDRPKAAKENPFTKKDSTNKMRFMNKDK